MIDLERTDCHNPLLMKDNCVTGQNPLFNVLQAYAYFDPEVVYCQGMNFVVSWILKFLQFKQDDQVMQNEVDAFFLLVHLMVKHQWRDVYKEGMIKIIKI